ASSETVVCTFTNTRKTGSVELKKVWSGTVGETTLNIGTAAAGSQDATKDLTGIHKRNDTTGPVTVDTGTYYFSEDSSGLGNYDTRFGCTGAVASPTTISLHDALPTLASSETVVCTFTNTRKTGSVELKKVWSGTVGETTLN